MKRSYEKPAIEVAEFRFSEHIAASGACSNQYTNTGLIGCDTQIPNGRNNA